MKHIIALVCALVLVSGCAVQNTAKTVVEKAYRVVEKVENVVTTTDSTNFVATVKVAEAPLKLVSMALDFAGTKVSDAKAKEYISITKATIDEIVKLIVTLEPSTVDTVRGALLAKITIVKNNVKLVGSYVGANINSVSISSAANLDDLAKDLENSLIDVKAINPTPVGNR